MHGGTSIKMESHVHVCFFSCDGKPRVAAHREKNHPQGPCFADELPGEKMEVSISQSAKWPEASRDYQIPLSHSSPIHLPCSMSPLVQRLLVAQVAKKIRPNKSMRLKHKAPLAGFQGSRRWWLWRVPGMNGRSIRIQWHMGMYGINDGLKWKKNWILILMGYGDLVGDIINNLIFGCVSENGFYLEYGSF